MTSDENSIPSDTDRPAGAGVPSPAVGADAPKPTVADRRRALIEAIEADPLLRRRRLAQIGAVAAVATAIPAAAFVGLVYRFPVWFVGSVGGPDAAVGAVITVLMMGVCFGAFLPSAAVGAGVGLVFHDLTGRRGPLPIRGVAGVCFLLNVLVGFFIGWKIVHF